MNNVNSGAGLENAADWQQACPQIAWGTLGLFVAYILGYILTISSALNGHLSYALAIPICGYLAFVGFTVLHDAGHGAIVQMGSRWKPLEDVLGWLCAVPLLLAPYRFFQKIHDRHHAFTNDPVRDPDHFTLGKKWYQVALNCLYIPFRYQIEAFTTLRETKVIRATYRSSLIYFVLVFGSILGLLATGFWLEVLCFILAPNIIAIFMLALFFDYIPHHPHKSRDRYHDTRIYPGAVLNALLLGQNYHLIHHMYPRVPWYKYREVFQRILPDLLAHDAPIEDVWGGSKPGLLKSPHVSGISRQGREINMVAEVKSVTRLTADSVAICFRLPEGEPLHYQAGQHLMVSKWLAGAQRSRCYSLCSASGKAELMIAVRQVEQGLMSGYLNQSCQVGDELILQGPYGDFVYPPKDVTAAEKLVLFAGGSGITPILAILETALEAASGPEVLLVYCGKNEKTLMFMSHIQSLLHRHTQRLRVVCFLSEQARSITAHQGRLTPDKVAELLSEQAFNALEANADFYICGPEGLNTMLVSTLNSLGIAETRVHLERFQASATAPEGELHSVAIRLADGQHVRLQVASNQTVLEVANAQGVPLSYACGVGTCGSCKMKVHAGQTSELASDVPGMTQAERAASFTLACQCRPLSALSLAQL